MDHHPKNGRSAWIYGAAALSLAVFCSGVAYYIVEDDKKVKRRKAGKKAERAALRTLEQIKTEAESVEKTMRSITVDKNTIHNEDDKAFKHKEYTLAHSNELLLRLMERLDAIRPLVLIIGDDPTIKPNEHEERLAANVRNRKRTIIESIESLFRRLDIVNAQLKEAATAREEIRKEKAAQLEKEKEAERLALEKEEARKKKEREAEEEQAKVAQEEARRRQREEEEEERLAKEALAKELENAVEMLAEKNDKVTESKDNNEGDAKEEQQQSEEEPRNGDDKIQLVVDEGARTPESNDFEHVERVEEEFVEDKTDVDVPQDDIVTGNEQDNLDSSVIQINKDKLEDEAMEKDNTTDEAIQNNDSNDKANGAVTEIEAINTDKPTLKEDLPAEEKASTADN
ncbi:hypothetical protein BDF20DRAFT_912984 [Mycotypha africana]|uniref:uncharacterized protein n=1 Tax=Mycotypha africana TaxID=64632 RepID=UPI0023008614|nr:uncharacterized protein BDF20DRAFT_912984 [Mycotypha africana]KAI8979394.1 hypothetical protein BDF20DRAFT_912984 [Mycotypha africana]